jgi:hypothetical protein
MNDNVVDIVDEVSGTLTGLISIFDMLGAVGSPNFRDITVSEFSWFIQQILEDTQRKVNSISHSVDSRRQ